MVSPNFKFAGFSQKYFCVSVKGNFISDPFLVLVIVKESWLPVGDREF